MVEHSTVQLLKDDYKVFKQYLLFFLHVHREVRSSEELRNADTRNAVINAYADLPQSPYQIEHLGTPGDSLYIHFDKEEPGFGDIDSDLFEYSDRESATCWQMSDDYGRESVYVRTMVVLNDTLFTEFKEHMSNKGLKLDGSVMPSARTEISALAQAIGAEMRQATEELLNQPTNSIKETPMSQARRVVNITLMDNDSAILEASDALVKTWKDIVTQDDDATTIQELIMTKDVAGAVKAHNASRMNMVDETILNNTGNEVKLRAIKLKDLNFIVTQA